MTSDDNLSPSVFEFDFDRSTAQAWDRFADRLAEVVSVMDDGARLSIGPLATDGRARTPYLSFACHADGRVVLTASEAPDAHLMEGNQEEAGALAHAAVDALRDVYGVSHPAFLAPDHLADILTPAPVEEPPRSSPFGEEDLTAVLPASRAELDALLEAELTQLLGHEPVRDDDGDFALRVGSTMVFIRPSNDAQEVLVFSALVHDVEGRSRAMEVLSDLNTDARWVRFLLVRDRVFVSLSLFAHPFVPAHLHQALGIVSVIGDHLDDELAAKLRGRTTFADEGPGAAGPPTEGN